MRKSDLLIPSLFFLVALGLFWRGPNFSNPSRDPAETLSSPVENLKARGLEYSPQPRAKIRDKSTLVQTPNGQQNASVLQGETWPERGTQSAYCEFKKMGLELPEGEGTRYYGSQSQVGEIENLHMMVKSPQCPSGMISLVSAARSPGQSWKLSDYHDCRWSTKSDLYRRFRVYGASEPVTTPPSLNQWNFAINGVGDFLTSCDGGGWVASRRGAFTLNSQGFLQDAFGCYLLNQSLEPATPNDRNRLAIIGHLQNAAIKSSEFLDRGRIWLDIAREQIHDVLSPQTTVEEGMLENLEDESRDELGYPNAMFESVQPCS